MIPIENTFDYEASAQETNGAVAYAAYIDVMRYPGMVRHVSNIMTQIQLLGGQVDLIKRAMFYGKVPPDLKLMMHDATFGVGLAEPPGTVASKLSYPNMNVVHGLIGVLSEMGELATIVRQLIEAEYLDDVNLAEEIGDVSWYSTIAANGADVRLGEVYALNRLKLVQKRHKDGFSLDSAVNRDAADEYVSMTDALAKLRELRAMQEQEEGADA